GFGSVLGKALKIGANLL
uniref:Caerulein precursor fragment-related peptide R1 n=1 Tax=Xenopus ruwenzoriensis TaxID=105430 RepID=CRR1_XENRU|nr:RecName: Full=Caerulein precursor fragment-related peptide R1; AltName: Full=CPF-RP-R1 [Xenopus ruwenzoriensis]